jgi:hypothetical protein
MFRRRVTLSLSAVWFFFAQPAMAQNQECTLREMRSAVASSRIWATYVQLRSVQSCACGKLHDWHINLRYSVADLE